LGKKGTKAGLTRYQWKLGKTTQWTCGEKTGKKKLDSSSNQAQKHIKIIIGVNGAENWGRKREKKEEKTAGIYPTFRWRVKNSDVLHP